MKNHSETVLVIIMSIILFSEGVWSVFDNPLLAISNVWFNVCCLDLIGALLDKYANS